VFDRYLIVDLSLGSIADSSSVGSGAGLSVIVTVVVFDNLPLSLAYVSASFYLLTSLIFYVTHLCFLLFII
jgi:hypothetical protein